MAIDRYKKHKESFADYLNLFGKQELHEYKEERNCSYMYLNGMAGFVTVNRALVTWYTSSRIGSSLCSAKLRKL